MFILEEYINENLVRSARKYLNNNKLAKRVNTSNIGVTVYNTAERAKDSARTFSKHPDTTLIGKDNKKTINALKKDPKRTTKILAKKMRKFAKKHPIETAAHVVTQGAMTLSPLPMGPVRVATYGTIRKASKYIRKKSNKEKLNDVRKALKTIKDLPKQSNNIPEPLLA